MALGFPIRTIFDRVNMRTWGGTGRAGITANRILAEYLRGESCKLVLRKVVVIEILLRNIGDGIVQKSYR
jgi:hypothetical protein